MMPAAVARHRWTSADYERMLAAGIPEYWLINLPERCLELYQQCMPDAASFSGWRYQARQRLREDQVAPLVAPAVVLAVDALLPSR